MNATAILSLVDQLEDSIDDVEENLEPLLDGALAATTKKLPLLERAKLNVVMVYAIESLLFSYLKLHGVAVKEHAVFRELTRVKQYFEKIKEAEEGPAKRRENLSLNKQAAGRFIKQALAGNDKLDLERAEREARERVLARRKLKDLEANMKEKTQAHDSANLEDRGEANNDLHSSQSTPLSTERTIEAPKSNVQVGPPDSVPPSESRKRKRNQMSRKDRKAQRRAEREDERRPQLEPSNEATQPLNYG